MYLFMLHYSNLLGYYMWYIINNLHNLFFISHFHDQNVRIKSIKNNNILCTMYTAPLWQLMTFLLPLTHSFSIISDYQITFGFWRRFMGDLNICILFLWSNAISFKLTFRFIPTTIMGCWCGQPNVTCNFRLFRCVRCRWSFSNEIFGDALFFKLFFLFWCKCFYTGIIKN